MLPKCCFQRKYFKKLFGSLSEEKKWFGQIPTGPILAAGLMYKIFKYLWLSSFEALVFCYQNCSDLLWEKIVLAIEKNFEIRGWRPRICKIFEITRTIYSNSERSAWFLVTECFFNLFLEVFIERIRIQIGKKYWDLVVREHPCIT